MSISKVKISWFCIDVLSEKKIYIYIYIYIYIKNQNFEPIFMFKIHLKVK